MIDQECFTHAWRSCMEPGHSVGKGRGRTVSLFGGRVPKPTWSIPPTDVPVQRPFLPLSKARGLLAADVEYARAVLSVLLIKRLTLQTLLAFLQGGIFK